MNLQSILLSKNLKKSNLQKNSNICCHLDKVQKQTKKHRLFGNKTGKGINREREGAQVKLWRVVHCGK